MTRTQGRIDRAGTINFGDASICLYEEGIARARNEGGYARAQAWERQFKRDVFSRIVQMLRRVGWTVGPWNKAEQYKAIALNHRTCSKGALQGELDICGRGIKFEMWQDLTPSENSNGGRYDFNKEARMPYVLRLEMERTRRRIRDYLCNVFAGYAFNARSGAGRSAKLGFMHLDAMEWIAECYRTSYHFKGDWAKYVALNATPGMAGCFNGNRRTADGVLLEHGQPVWCFDYRGRIQQGTAYYNINNMWWVALGRYDVTNKASFELYAACPANPRIKRNADRRRKRLEAELAKAIKAMQFEHAAKLRDILFPGAPALFNVWHDEHQLYHRAGFCGYTADQSQAGKFTADEVHAWGSAPNRVIAIAAAVAAREAAHA
jgi:hypothetical protein